MVRTRAYLAGVALLAGDAAGFLSPSRAAPVAASRALGALRSTAESLKDREDVLRAVEMLMGRTGGSADWEIDLCSPSKINLFLRIVRRRDDG